MMTKHEEIQKGVIFPAGKKTKHTLKYLPDKAI